MNLQYKHNPISTQLRERCERLLAPCSPQDVSSANVSLVQQQVLELLK
jgi:hypothetical protein